jgi:hypothetical protein
MELTDLWAKKRKDCEDHKCITYGRTMKNKNGEKVPCEEVLTFESERMHELCLDYIF